MSMEEICCSRRRLVPDNIWIAIFSYLHPKDVLNCRRVSSGWRFLSSDSTLWRSVSISDFVDDAKAPCISGGTLLQLIENSHRLESFDVRNCLQLTNRFIMNLSLKAAYLRHINLEGLVRVTDRGVNTLAKYCNGLESVNILNTLVTDHGLCNLLSSNRFLCELTASTYAVTCRTVEVLGAVPRVLRLLHVDQNRASAALKSKQKHLDILTSKMVEKLAASCQKLQILIMKYSRVRLSDVALHQLAQNCQMLECLELGVLDWNSGISSAALANLCNCLCNLQYLDLYDSEATDLTLESIAKTCPRLKHLSLDCCRGFNDTGVLALMSKCKELESLSLGSGWDGRLSNISALAIAKSDCAKNLIKLSMRVWDINDFGLFCLSACTPNLQHLSIEGCLYITCAGLNEALQNWCKLVSLDMSFTCCIKEDKEFESLAMSLTSLQKLVAYECGVSPVALCKLKGQIPYCSIESDQVTL